MQASLDFDEQALAVDENTTAGVVPFKSQLLKWIGNKQRFAHEIISFFPRRFQMYHEPFLGSGAVLGVLAPRRAEAALAQLVLANHRLMDTDPLGDIDLP